LYYANCNVALLMFSVVYPPSFEEAIHKWYPEIIHFCGDIPIILVGAFAELRNDFGTLMSLVDKGLSPINTEQSQEVADKLGIQYIECSGLTVDGNLDNHSNGVNKIFSCAVKSVVFQRKKKAQKCTVC